MTEFALPLPMAVIGELVGRARRGPGRPAAPGPGGGAKGIEPVLSEEETEAAIEAIAVLGEYFVGLARRSAGGSPRDDLLSALVEARENDDRLTDEEIVSTAILLFAAGFETTTNLLGNGLLALLAHPDQLADWRAHPDIASSAVEELLRFDSPVQFNLRTALEPADLLGEPLGARRPHRRPAGRGQPRPGALRPTRRARPPAPRQHAVELRLGHPSLHRCARWPGWRVRSPSTRCWRGSRSIELRDDEPHWRPSFTLRGLARPPAARRAAD